jgi:2-polyprenyl-6-methoxyphenol hydroxylase-like FAD-dependent oxidoreductase
MKIVCVGGGPAGLYLSILMKLRDPKHDITVFERRNANSASGWGVTFGRNLLGLLYDCDPESADRIREAAFVWHDQVAHVRGERLVAAGNDCYNISRWRLLDVLAARAQGLGVRIEYGREVLNLSQLPEADLIVAADGANSRIRQDVGSFRTLGTSGSNKFIWLGTDKVFKEFNFLFVPTNSGWIWGHAYGIDSESSTFIVECTPETWAGLGFDTMPADDALPILEKLFSDHLADHHLIGELGDGNKARWLNFRTISNEHWYSGKIVLVGDSAHTAHFAIGMGMALAIEDAVVLADNLHQHSDIELALQSYERRRQAELLPILAGARYSARWFEEISRYIDRNPRQFGVLLYARRSPLIALLPPIVSYLLCRAAERITILDSVRDRVAPAAKVIYGRRKLALGGARRNQAPPRRPLSFLADVELERPKDKHAHFS